MDRSLISEAAKISAAEYANFFLEKLFAMQPTPEELP